MIQRFFYYSTHTQYEGDYKTTSFVMEDEMIVCLGIIMVYLRTLITLKEVAGKEYDCVKFGYSEDVFWWKIKYSKIEEFNVVVALY